MSPTLCGGTVLQSLVVVLLAVTTVRAQDNSGQGPNPRTVQPSLELIPYIESGQLDLVALASASVANIGPGSIPEEHNCTFLGTSECVIPPDNCMAQDPPDPPDLAVGQSMVKIGWRLVVKDCSILRGFFIKCFTRCEVSPDPHRMKRDAGVVHCSDVVKACTRNNIGLKCSAANGVGHYDVEYHCAANAPLPGAHKCHEHCCCKRKKNKKHPDGHRHVPARVACTDALLRDSKNLGLC